MKNIIILVFLLIGFRVEAQTLIDADLQRYVRQTLIDGIKVYGNDVNDAGVVIMEVNTGNVIANISIGQYKGTVKDIPYGNSEAIPSGISRAVLYLAMMGTLDPSYVVDTYNGIYTDSIMGCTITDMAYSRGGFGSLTLKKGFDLSDVAIMKAVEVAFGKNMARYGAALRKTGVFFSDIDNEGNYTETDSYRTWSPCDIMGYRSPYSLLQQVAYINMVANGGDLLLRLNENDSAKPICKVRNKAGLDSLASAMFETVEYGTGSKMKSKYIRVAGIVNVSPADAINCRGCFAAAFFPYDNPHYTIGLFVNKHDKPAGRNIASKIAGNIIEFMIKHYLHLCHVDEGTFDEKKVGKYHPSEK